VIAGTDHIERYTHPLGFPEMNANLRGEPNERLVVDYISGMTDPFAIATFERIFVLAPGT
jgi:dGTP triphosphohydrolase